MTVQKKQKKLIKSILVVISDHETVGMAVDSGGEKVLWFFSALNPFAKLGDLPCPDP